MQTALWRSPIPEEAIDSDSEDDTPANHRPVARRGERLRIPGRVNPTTSGLQSPFSVQSSALFSSSFSNNCGFLGDPPEMRAHLRIQEHANRLRAESSLKEAAYRASFSDPEDALNEDPAAARAKLLARQRAHRQTLNDTERYHDRMSHSLKRKVVIMGAPSVGKTSLTQQFVAPPTYTASYHPTVEVTSHKTITYAGQEYDCEIIDSAGQDEYTLFPSKYANGVHGYLLVYSINSRQSFEMITTIYDKIVDFSGARQIPVVVVGQKCDLRPEDRRVSTAEGQALAKKIGGGFIESSAKDNKNVIKAFEVLCAEMQKQWNPAPEKKKQGWMAWMTGK